MRNDEGTFVGYFNNVKHAEYIAHEVRWLNKPYVLCLVKKNDGNVSFTSFEDLKLTQDDNKEAKELNLMKQQLRVYLRVP